MTSRGPQVAGELAIDRLMRQLDYRLTDAAPLTRQQVAVVLRALADHTAITAALRWRVDPDSPWPEATSIGRWLHDTADQVDLPPSAPGRNVDWARLYGKVLQDEADAADQSRRT